MSTSQTIRDRLAAKDTFSLAEVRHWMAEESSLELWAAVYDVLGGGFCRVKPEPDMEETCAFMMRYLLRCISENVTSKGIPTGYEAANLLADCLKFWATKLPQTRPVMLEAAQRITDAYLHADARERDRLLNGTHEHAMESATVRPFFRRWKTDPALRDAWGLAMDWAITYGDPEPPRE